jgi:FtsP/CotA-like multicopper oxidase with cupredoxin domain
MIAMTGNMISYHWGLAAPTQHGISLPVRLGERIRLVLENRTMMWHPIHLHGHTFQLDLGARPGPRKDTVIVPPMARVTFELTADNPGQWALHCHNIYHAQTGMMTILAYVK